MYLISSITPVNNNYSNTYTAAPQSVQPPDIGFSEIMKSGTEKKQYPLTAAPDYSVWDREDAYCDIVKRYDLLNLLSRDKARQMGLGAEYQQMTDEINKVLYGGDPVKMGMSIEQIREIDDDVQQRLNKKVYSEVNGITSDAEYESAVKRDIMKLYNADNFNVGRGDGGLPDDAQIFQSLSAYGLTDQKTSIIGTMSLGTLTASMNYQHANSGSFVNMYDYIDSARQNAKLQYMADPSNVHRYKSYIEWSDFIMDMYDNYA